MPIKGGQTSAGLALPLTKKKHGESFDSPALIYHNEIIAEYTRSRIARAQKKPCKMRLCIFVITGCQSCSLFFAVTNQLYTYFGQFAKGFYRVFLTAGGFWLISAYFGYRSAQAAQ
jgi:hypothetical protein